MLFLRSWILRGFTFGLLLAVALYSWFAAWMKIRPTAFEGAWDLISALAFFLGFPTSWFMEMVFDYLFDRGRTSSLSLMDLWLLSVVLNWTLLGLIVEVVRRRLLRPRS